MDFSGAVFLIYITLITKKKQHQKNALIGIICFLLLNFPFLGMANKHNTIAGFPVLFIYVFAVWAFVILSGFLIIRRLNTSKRKRSE